MKAYHFLKANMCGGWSNEPPWEIGEERELKGGKIELCLRGYHSSPSWLDALLYAPGPMACIVQISKPIQKNETKYVSRKRKLIDARYAEKALSHWAYDCAERALKKTKVRDPRSWNAIALVRLYNEGQATREQSEAAWDAAWDIAWNVAWHATVGDVARAAEIRWQKRRLNWYMNKLFKEVKNE